MVRLRANCVKVHFNIYQVDIEHITSHVASISRRQVDEKWCYILWLFDISERDQFFFHPWIRIGANLFPVIFQMCLLSLWNYWLECFCLGWPYNLQFQVSFFQQLFGQSWIHGKLQKKFPHLLLMKYAISSIIGLFCVMLSGIKQLTTFPFNFPSFPNREYLFCTIQFLSNKLPCHI